MRVLLSVVVSCLASLSVCSGKCDFAPRWGAGQWIVQNVFTNNNTISMLIYSRDSAHMIYSNNPETEISRFTCDQFSTSGNHTYYVRNMVDDAKPKRRVCVDDIQTSNVILHREAEHDASSGTPTVIGCKTQLSKINVYDILLPNGTNNNEQFFPETVPYPFSTMAYRVRYILPDGTEECKNSHNSVLVLSPEIISILACNYKNHPNYPLTGLISSVSGIDPRQLGEEDDNNGKILIMKWSSKLIPHSRVYCVRYKMMDNKNLMMSFDLTSGEPNTKLRCRKGHRYDDKGTIEGRNYFLLVLGFDSALVSRPPPRITTPQPTARPTPQSSVFPTTPEETVMHTELTLVIHFNNITDRKTFQEEVITVVKNTLKIDGSRISDVAISKDDEYTIMTFNLEDGSPSSKYVSEKLKDLIYNKGYTIQTSEYQVRADKVYFWKDGPCPDVDCQTGQQCVPDGGTWRCHCVGENCSIVASSSKKTVYIAIGVVVGVLFLAAIIFTVFFIRCRKNKEKDADTDDSEMTYTNSNSRSMEALDRELYSTINKKPKAFHEKSFSSLDKDEDYGERTGIHL